MLYGLNNFRCSLPEFLELLWRFRAAFRHIKALGHVRVFSSALFANQLTGPSTSFEKGHGRLKTLTIVTYASNYELGYGLVISFFDLSGEANKHCRQNQT